MKIRSFLAIFVAVHLFSTPVASAKSKAPSLRRSCSKLLLKSPELKGLLSALSGKGFGVRAVRGFKRVPKSVDGVPSWHLKEALFVESLPPKNPTDSKKFPPFLVNPESYAMLKKYVESGGLLLIAPADEIPFTASYGAVTDPDSRIFTLPLGREGGDVMLIGSEATPDVIAHENQHLIDYTANLDAKIRSDVRTAFAKTKNYLSSEDYEILVVALVEYRAYGAQSKFFNEISDLNTLENYIDLSGQMEKPPFNLEYIQNYLEHVSIVQDGLPKAYREGFQDAFNQLLEKYEIRSLSEARLD